MFACKSYYFLSFFRVFKFLAGIFSVADELFMYPCKSWKAAKSEPGAWGYNWATLSLGDTNRGTWFSRLGV